jgi:hypothetical protein
MILPKIYKPNNEYMRNEERINYFNKMIDNQEIMKKINSRPLFINYNLRKKDITYDIKCIFCKGTSVYMSDYLELQRCIKCCKEYVPKVIELK